MLRFAAVCCSVVQCVALWCSVVQSVAVCCSLLQSVAVCCIVSNRQKVGEKKISDLFHIHNLRQFVTFLFWPLCVAMCHKLQRVDVLQFFRRLSFGLDVLSVFSFFLSGVSTPQLITEDQTECPGPLPIYWSTYGNGPASG